MIVAIAEKVVWPVIFWLLGRTGRLSAASQKTQSFEVQPWKKTKPKQQQTQQNPQTNNELHRKQQVFNTGCLQALCYHLGCLAEGAAFVCMDSV